ncbi:MAG: DEAD/DEAH box helicase family protein [Oscillibacter sp.]|nr:type I restriction endonuclease [Oscillibacter sp.]MEA4994175.1 DEAD/DEAH box helicase family protein [Oscillibacter sp.]
MGINKIKHNEDSRVKIPALLHFTRLGYTYQRKTNSVIDTRNNIFVDIFAESIRKINGKAYSDMDIQSFIKEIEKLTDNNVDKGEAFFNRLVKSTGAKFIDFEKIYRNDFRVVTELPFVGEKNTFRPDITILINGIPVGFLEVKKPNNQEGIQKEFRRMRERFGFNDCTHFFNQLQLLGFSNNQDYDDEERVRRVGSFYTTPNWKDTKYNLFREEEEIYVKEYISDEDLAEVLTDTNSLSLSTLEEFKTNLRVETPCNKFITSVFSIHRLMFFIKYGIVYVNSPVDGLNKHILRYPQYFAIQKTVEKLEKENMKRGVVWHTQGSGKTALAYYLTNVLRNHYRKNRIVTKFYFVVDRLDLLIQATGEFSSRGMTIASINSKHDFANNIKSSAVIGADTQQGTYKETMNVVNIQKFSEESSVELKGAGRVQRIYFIDEVHRGYKVKGQFLANLLGADPNGIYIGLTGTPILKEDFKTTDIFEGYIHKYYYNKSIADGYTLKIKKENIATEFKEDIRGILRIGEDEKIASTKWNYITERPEFVQKFCEYIQKDFSMFRENDNVDKSVGFMVVASTTGQAKSIHEWFNTNGGLNTALVLSDDEYSKDNKEKQEGFRGKKNKETGKIESKYDGVIVFNMLLTGFDAPRLKRLYLLREIREHNLLQTLARVNRPYKNMQYGYVVDFVDITEQYEETNRRYLEELKGDLQGEDEDVVADIDDFFVDVDKAKKTIKDITTKHLFIYMPNIETNLEDFSRQIEPLELDELREIKKYLTLYKESYNELRMSHENVSDIPIDRINKAFYEVSNRISIKVLEGYLDSDDEDVDDIDFTQLIIEFFKTGEIDLEFDMGNDILEKINKVQNAMSSNGDKKDPDYLELYRQYKDIIRSIKEMSRVTDANSFVDDLSNLEKKFLILNNT